MAHKNLSAPMDSGRSVNNMVDEHMMDPCLFGFCMLRALHQLHDMRSWHPRLQTFLSKIDLDAAFRCLYVWLLHALTSFTIIQHLSYLIFCMPFGVKDDPSKHTIPSKMAVDLAQELINHPTWDPATLHSLNKHLLPKPKANTDDTNFGFAHFFAIKINR